MRFRLLPWLFVFALAVAACGPADEDDAELPLPTALAASVSSTAPAADQVVIGFGAQEFARTKYQPLIDLFNSENPDIYVEFVSLDPILQEGDAYIYTTEKVARAVDVFESYDVSSTDASQRLVLDLHQFIDSDPNFKRDDFFPIGMRELNGGLYSIPLMLNLPVLRYNRTMWDSAGLALPTPDWSWTDFTSTLSELAKKDGDVVETYGLVNWNSPVTMLFGDLAANGIKVDENADPFRIDDSTVVAAISRIADLNSSGGFFAPSYEPGSDDYATMQSLIDTGNAGMWNSQIANSNELPYDVGTAIFPQQSAIQQVYGEQLAISAGTQAPQAAWRWLAFVSSQGIDGMTDFSNSLGSVPARRSLAEQSGYWNDLDQEAAAAVQALLEQPNQATRSVYVDQAFGPLETAFKAVRKGIQPDVAARDAQAEVDQLVAAAPTANAQATAVPFVVTPPERVEAAAGATKITFMVPYDVGTYGALAKQFNQDNPDLFVDLQAAPAAGEISMASLAQSSDCFMYWSSPDQANYSSLLDLQPLIDADASFALGDYPDSLLARYRANGSLYGLPQEINVLVLGYNAAAFEQAGIAPPTAEWTIDDLREAATVLTEGQGDDKRYGFGVSSSADTLTYLDQVGVPVTTGSGNTIQPNFTAPDVAQAIREYIDLLRNVSPNTTLSDYHSTAAPSTDIFSLQTQGRLGMWYQFSLNQGYNPNENKDLYDPAVAPLPSSATLNAGIVNGNSLYISATTQHQEACWKWLSYLSSDASVVSYGIPARISVAESAAFLDNAPIGAAEVVESYKALPQSNRQQPWWQSDIDLFWFSRALDHALQGKDLDRELDEAQRLTTDYLACARTGDPGSTCAKQVDPTYNGWQTAQ